MKFHRIKSNEIVRDPQMTPPINDTDYQLCADRNPPILSEVLTSYFRGCNKACTKGHLDILSILHECHSRNHRGKYKYLGRLPKRRTRWDVGSDDEKDEAWGINALFSTPSGVSGQGNGLEIGRADLYISLL